MDSADVGHVGRERDIVEDLERHSRRSEQFAIDNPGFQLMGLGWKRLRVRGNNDPQFEWLPSATVQHEESGQTFEDWGDTFPQAIASSLLNLRIALGIDDTD